MRFSINCTRTTRRRKPKQVSLTGFPSVAHRDGGGMVSMAIHRCRKITIAAVNGHAVGVGVTALQLPFDFRFVWGGAKLALPFVRRGIGAEGTPPPIFRHNMDSSMLTNCSTSRLNLPAASSPRLLQSHRPPPDRSDPLTLLSPHPRSLLLHPPHARRSPPRRHGLRIRTRSQHFSDFRSLH